MEIFDGNTTTESEFYRNINIAVQSNSVAQSLLSDLLKNISLVLEDIRTEKNRQNFVSPFPSIDARLRNVTSSILSSTSTAGDGSNDVTDNDNANAYLYILFVLTFYAFSIVILMVKYIRREREGSKLEYYYNEFVKRDWYKDKNLYDNRGRRIHYDINGKRKNGPMKYSSVKVSEEMDMTPNVFENRSVKELIRVSARTASLTLGGNSYEDDESIFTFHDRDSLPYSITSTDDTCSKETKGIKGNLKQLNEINEIAGSSLPIQIHQTESIGLASGAVPKRSSNNLSNNSKFDIHGECSNKFPIATINEKIEKTGHINLKIASNDIIEASPFLTDNDKLEATEMDEDVSLAFLPCGSSKLVFAKVDESSGPPPAVLKPLARAFSRSKLTTQNSTRSLNINFKSNLAEEYDHTYPQPCKKEKHSYEAINEITNASSSPKRRVTIDQGFERKRKHM